MQLVVGLKSPFLRINLSKRDIIVKKKKKNPTFNEQVVATNATRFSLSKFRTARHTVFEAIA